MPEFIHFERMMRALFRGAKGPQGIITLEDGKTRCRSVVCREGVYAKDIIAEVCSTHDLQIAPVAQPFFALCDRLSLHPVSPYKKMDAEDLKKQYQLRIFVNTGGNSMHFQKMSKSTYSYYHKQLKEDFIQDRLFPRATINTAVWMAAIDMAREALDKKKDFNDLTKSVREMQRYMPKFLVEKYQKDPEMRQKLKSTFDRFNAIQENITPNHFVGKYIEVYEKDKMCGRHIYRLRQGGRQRVQFLLVVSAKDGVYKTRGDDPTEEKEPALWHIEDVRALRVDLSALSVTVETEKPGAGGTKSIETLHFTDRKELISFSVVVHTYHQILVDVTATILAGDLNPSDECLRIGKDDGFRRDVCHGPITPYEVNKVLNRLDNKKTGNYLIRESRNVTKAYTLSLCAIGQIFNYRVICSSDGEYCFEGPEGDNGSNGHSMFSTMKGLIEHYSLMQNGLPCRLGTNICPNIAPIPLIPSASSLHSDTSSSTTSVIMSNSRGCFSDVSSSSEHSPNSTPPSSPHSQDTPPTPSFRSSFPHPMSDTSSNFPDSSLTSNIPTDTSNTPTDTSNTSSIPQSDTSGTSSLPIPQSDTSGTSSLPANSLVPLPSERPSILSLSQSPGSIHKPLIPRTLSSISPSPNTSETEFLSQIAPRKPTIDIKPIPASAALSKPQNPLIKELIDVGVNYIRFGELEIIGDLGSGNYSQVHLANWSTGQSGVVKVAVKIPTAKPNTVDEVKKELQREIETMAALNHPNIVHLLGISEVQHFISYIGELPVVIMEYVEGGSLRGFLDKVKKNPALASLKLFLSFGKQMADGMKYLEEKKLVHRDLAARNVLLVKETEQVKISDFGLARQSTNSSKDYAYYIGQNSSNGLPIFWYAPECLRNLRFTTKGDVWSYGVTLWEMFSHGELPTQILSRVIKDSSVTSAQAAFKKLADHLEHPQNRLPRRMNCPAEVYSLMNECWNCRPSERPSFSELSVKMEILLNLAIAKAAKARRKAVQDS